MSEQLNRTIGGYHLVDRIGGGGVAEVYRARPSAAGGRDVAIKIIYPEFARQPGVTANFTQITRAAAQLASHPHILPLLGSGEDHEYLYVVTPLVEEGSLARWIANGGRLSAGDVGPFFQQLCGAVSYAHSLGITHGNIKPSNVFLFEGRHVLLGDFGLLWDVRALDPSWSGSDVAAFEFLAPEVFDGRASPASDIYSLGATLFATLTGHAPFQAQRLGDLVTAARQQTPPSLAHMAPPVSGPIVALDGVVRQAMAKQVEQRFNSAIALAQAIEGTLLQAPPNAQLPPASSQFAPAAPPAHWDAPIPVQPAPPAQWSAAVPPSPQSLGGPSAPLGQMNPPFAPPAVLEGPTMHMPSPPVATDDFTTPPDQGDPTARGGIRGQPIPAVMPLAQIPGSPAVQPVPPAQHAGEQSGVFSATELGLPRLTTPEMENLPAGWRDLLNDENARKRHDPFAENEADLAPLPSPSELMPSISEFFPALRANSGPGEQAAPMREPSGAQPGKLAQSQRQPWEPSEPKPALAGSRRGAHADYDIEQMTNERLAVRSTPRNSSPLSPKPGKSKREEFDPNTLQGQKVWTNSHTIVRGRRRSKTPFLIILTLLILTGMELTGLAVMRPDICVTHACTVVANEVRHYIPNLRLPGITAAVRINPTVPAVSVVEGSSGQTAFTLVNTSADPINWSVSATLSWMTISPARGALVGHGNMPITVTVKPYGVAPGVYTGGMTVIAGYGQVVEPIVVTVKPAAQLTVAQRSLAITKCGVPESLTLSNSGSQRLTYTASPSQASALAVSPSSGSLAPGASTGISVTVSCDATAGTYAVILVSDGGSAQVIVTYT
jgi:serine/threonine protein kinase